MTNDGGPGACHPKVISTVFTLALSALLDLYQNPCPFPLLLESRGSSDDPARHARGAHLTFGVFGCWQIGNLLDQHAPVSLWVLYLYCLPPKAVVLGGNLTFQVVFLCVR